MWQEILKILGVQAISFAFIVGLIFTTIGIAWCFRLRSLNRTTPLVKELLRPPGYSLSRRIEKLEEEMVAHFALIISFPGFCTSFCLGQIVLSGVDVQMWMLLAPVIATIIASVILGRRASKLAERRRLLMIAMDGEMFVGEELNQLMLHGCRVFHDVPYQYGNIDHVVVSKSGVYAVNTKTLGKLKDEDDKAGVIVNYQTGMMQFPDRQVRIDKDAAESEVRWLSSTLSAASAIQVNAEAMLALPGWFIKQRIGHPGTFPFVLNPAKAVQFFVRSADRYSKEEIAAISHQLDQLCRDVKPNEKPEEPRWED